MRYRRAGRELTLNASWGTAPCVEIGSLAPAFPVALKNIWGGEIHPLSIPLYHKTGRKARGGPLSRPWLRPYIPFRGEVYDPLLRGD